MRQKLTQLQAFSLEKLQKSCQSQSCWNYMATKKQLLNSYLKPNHEPWRLSRTKEIKYKMYSNTNGSWTWIIIRTITMSKTGTCCHSFQSSRQTCTWVENREALPQIPEESLPPSSSWSAEGEITLPMNLSTFCGTQDDVKHCACALQTWSLLHNRP